MGDTNKDNQKGDHTICYVYQDKEESTGGSFCPVFVDKVEEREEGADQAEEGAGEGEGCKDDGFRRL